MRVLVVGDSHCREMAGDFAELVPDIPVLIVSKGRDTSLVRGEYFRQLAIVREFGPSHVVLHSGHNDLSYHWRYNVEPTRLEDFYPILEEFICILKSENPGALLYVSSIFPRCIGRGFTEADRLMYNRLCVRCGELTRSSGNKDGYSTMLNNPLWVSVRKRVERSELFMPDGLHLTKVGRRAIVQHWISNMKLV
jgi:hypothetical protein